MTKTEKCAEALTKGKMALLPTDVCYGVFASAFSDMGVEKIFRATKKSRKESLQVFFPSVALVLVVAELTLKNRRQLDKYLPGPWSVKLRIKKGFKKAFPFLPDDTITARIPKDSFLREVILKTGSPIIFAPANISGTPPPLKFGDVDKSLVKKAGFIEKNDRMASGKDGGIVDMTGAKAKGIKRDEVFGERAQRGCPESALKRC